MEILIATGNNATEFEEELLQLIAANEHFEMLIDKQPSNVSTRMTKVQTRSYVIECMTSATEKLKIVNRKLAAQGIDPKSL